MKKLIVAALLCIGSVANAQDTIHYLHSEPLIVKLEEVNPGKIKYKLWDHPNGPSYIMVKRDIARITTADGKVIWLNEKQWEQYNKLRGDIDEIRAISSTPRRHYKRNIITLHPIALLNIGAGPGISFERLNSKGTLGVRAFVMSAVDYGGTFFVPSLRFYPFGQRLVSFFISPGLVAGYGSHLVKADSIDTYTNKRVDYRKTEQAPQVGFIVETGFILHLTPRITLSGAMGGGINYIDLADASNVADPAIGKLELGFGYRF